LEVMSTTDYCELCDLPRSQCIHGQPPPPEPKKTVAAPSRPKKAPVTRTPAAPAKAPARLRWTPPEVFKPLIVSVLEQAGGELEADELYQALEAHAGDQLRDADHERTPEGELRWQYAARRARVALIAEGRMAKGRPGVWQLA
jgi:hypothetical protein